MRMKNFLQPFGWKAWFVAGIASMGMVACSDDDVTGDDNNSGTEIPPISEANTPTPNPYLAAEHYSVTHFNSAQTDGFPYNVKSGTFQVDINDCEGSWSGPVNLMTLSSTDPDYMWNMSSDRVAYVYVGNGSFTRVSEAALPGVTTKTEEELRKVVADYNSVDEVRNAITPFLGEYPQFVLSSGNYVICDKDNYAYINAVTRVVRYKLKDASDPTQGIVLDKQINLQDYNSNIQTMVGLVMTYDGNLVAVVSQGILIISRDLSTIKDFYVLPEGQKISNSVAVDENNGIYVVSSSTTANGEGIMQKIIWNGSKLSTDEADGAWQATYDGGPEAPSIKMGFGSGSTPTLMGFGDDDDKLVVITDGAKRMKLAAFWRDEIPEDAVAVDPENPRLAGEIEASCGLPETTEWIQSEQSVVTAGYGAFVVNNIAADAVVNDKLVGVLSIGPILEQPTGVERFQWNTEKNSWVSVWTRGDVSSTSMIPAVSTSSNLVFVNGYDANDGWDVKGLDWNSGATQHRVVFGKNNRGNGAYAIIQYMENGDLLFNSVSGPFRVKL